MLATATTAMTARPRAGYCSTLPCTAHSLLAFCVASAAAVTSAVRLAELSTGLESMMARRM